MNIDYLPSEINYDRREEYVKSLYAYAHAWNRVEFSV